MTQIIKPIITVDDSSLPPACPLCRSKSIRARNYGKKAGGAVGTVAGAALGASSALGGAELGASIGLVAGPAGAVLGGLAGAIVGGLFGGSAGCVAGAKAGEVIDTHVLDNYCCLACDHTFGSKSQYV
jgi:hypothetical protein